MADDHLGHRLAIRQNGAESMFDGNSDGWAYLSSSLYRDQNMQETDDN